MLDAFVRRFFPKKAYDKDAEIARRGHVLPDLLATLKSDDFFKKPFPKTTGPELFNIEYVEKAIKNTPSVASSLAMTSPQFLALKSDNNRLADQQIADLLATLTRFSAETIAEAIRNVFVEKQFSDATIRGFKIYMSGGGMHNPLLVNWLRELLPEIEFKKTNDLGINGDAKEAVLFAILANECVAGNPTDFGNRAGVPSVSMGKISFPN